MKSIGWRIRKALEAKGWKQKELSEKTGIPENTISDIVNDRRNPGVYNIQLIADALDLDMHWLVTGESYKLTGTKKTLRVAEASAQYKAKLPTGKIIQERRSHYKGKHIAEIIVLLKKLPVENRHFLLKLVQHIISEN